MTQPALEQRFKSEHAQLEQLFAALIEASNAGAGAGRDLAELWARFDHQLSSHLEFEETHILPAFARIAPVEAAALIDEHAQIRARLAELGVGVDLHTVRAAMVTGFMEALRQHAIREDGLLYRWVGEQARAVSAHAMH